MEACEYFIYLLKVELTQKADMSNEGTSVLFLVQCLVLSAANQRTELTTDLRVK